MTTSRSRAETVREFSDNLKKAGYKALKHDYPTLQKRIFDVLVALTPKQLEFMVNCRKDDKSMGFNWEGLDTSTYYLIGDVLVELIGDPRLIVTEHDVMVSYGRFRELIWTYECVRQGLFNEVQAEDGTTKYVPTEVAPKREPSSSTPYRQGRYWAKIKTP
jgi:hypothetical protein